MVCRFLVALPDHSWLRRFTSDHAGVRLEILHRVETEDGRVVDDVRLGPRESPSFAREIARHPDVLQVENLQEAGDAGVYRVTYRLPRFLHTVREFGAPPRFPFVVQDGTSRWTFVLRASSVGPFVEELRSHVPGVEVQTFRPPPGSRNPKGLTVRQREVFHRAMRDGYFDVPRRVTLTDLARRLGVSKSTLSESLAIAERKLLEGIAIV